MEIIIEPNIVVKKTTKSVLTVMSTEVVINGEEYTYNSYYDEANNLVNETVINEDGKDVTTFSGNLMFYLAKLP